MFIDGLRINGVEVTECHAPFWESFPEKAADFGFSLNTVFKFIKCQLKLAWRYTVSIPDHDIVMVGFIGQPDIFLARLLTWLTGRKLVFNPLVSIYDTVVGDREYVNSGSLKAGFFKWLDKITGKMADLILLDTNAHIDYFREAFGLGREKFQRIWVGADETVFKPARLPEKKTGKFEVLFVGKFIPLHGLPKIIETAKLLESEDIHFTLVGRGQLREGIERQIEQLKIKNITLIDWIPYKELSVQMATADLILGIFGDSDKARRVIPNKVFQALAVGKPVLTMDSPGTRELLFPDQTAFLVEAEPKAMANAIRVIRSDSHLRKRVGDAGYKLHLRKLTTVQLGKAIKAFLENLVTAS